MAGTAAQARPPVAWVRRLGFLAALFTPQAAHAGAWIAAEEGRAISTVGYREEDGVRGYETDVYYERPFNDRYAFVTTGYYSQDTDGFTDDESAVALKAVVARGARFAAAVQAGVTWRSIPEPGCTTTGGEIRGLAGLSSRGGNQFGNLEIAYREAGGCGHVRYEATWGVRPRANWLVLTQAFADDDLRFGETVKLQASAVRFTRKGRGLQLGVRLRVDGGDVIEPTIILGYWSAARQ